MTSEQAIDVFIRLTTAKTALEAALTEAKDQPVTKEILLAVKSIVRAMSMCRQVMGGAE